MEESKKPNDDLVLRMLMDFTLKIAVIEGKLSKIEEVLNKHSVLLAKLSSN